MCIRDSPSTRNIDNTFPSPSGNCLAMASPRPSLVIHPSLAAISCNTMVAMMEKTIAHNKLYPVSTPANVQVVTVPGPINAAATKVLGPKYLLNQLFI